MIKELYNLGYLNIEKIILNEAKNLDISPIEALTLIEILNTSKQSKKINKTVIMINLRLTVHEVDEILNSLLEKSFYEIYLSYEGNKGDEFISLDPLFHKLDASISTPSALKVESEIEEVIQLLQTKMNKNLTANELEYVKDWVFKDGYTNKRILDVIVQLENANKRITFRNVLVAITNGGGGHVTSPAISNLLTKIKK